MKILVFVEHDIIIRHFLHSRVFDKLIEQHDVAFVFPEKGYKRVTIDSSTLGLGAPVHHLTVHVERLKLWQGLFLADMLRWRTGRHFAAMRRFHRRAVGLRATMIYSILSLPGAFQLFLWWSRRRIGKMPYRDLETLLKHERPDVLIHPSILSGVFINDLVVASSARSIPLVVVMNSWDNPSTKRAMTGQPDWLLVWGPQTQAHAVEFMGMPPERVICFGAAQLDLYRNQPRIDRVLPARSIPEDQRMHGLLAHERLAIPCVRFEQAVHVMAGVHTRAAPVAEHFLCAHRRQRIEARQRLGRRHRLHVAHRAGSRASSSSPPSSCPVGFLPRRVASGVARSPRCAWPTVMSTASEGANRCAPVAVGRRTPARRSTASKAGTASVGRIMGRIASGEIEIEVTGC
jgi:hypothetical protein